MKSGSITDKKGDVIDRDRNTYMNHRCWEEKTQKLTLSVTVLESLYSLSRSMRNDLSSLTSMSLSLNCSSCAARTAYGAQNKN